MNIIEAISDSLMEVTKLSDTYIGRIYADGIISYYKPVDVRVNRIIIPLAKSDLSFIYDNTSKKERIHKVDAKLDTYYPIGSEITLIDGGVFQIDSYGPIKRYNDNVYVDIYCTFKSEEYHIIENISNTSVESKVRQEMNKIIESNEIIKSLLPQYDNNWLKFSDDDINAIENLNAMNTLSIFNTLEYQERYALMSNIDSALYQKYESLPTTVVNVIKNISDISLTPMIKAGFLGYHSEYNPRYIFEGLIYIFENMLLRDDSLYNEFYLLNKLDQKCKISIEKVNNVIIFNFDTPTECNANYILEVYNWSNYGSYIKYGIDNIKLYRIDKETLEKIENTNVSTNQGDYLKVCTEIFSILSASNYSDVTLSEYYDNIDTMLNNIETISLEIVETEKEEAKDESSEA